LKNGGCSPGPLAKPKVGARGHQGGGCEWEREGEHTGQVRQAEVQNEAQKPKPLGIPNTYKSQIDRSGLPISANFTFEAPTQILLTRISR